MFRKRTTETLANVSAPTNLWLGRMNDVSFPMAFYPERIWLNESAGLIA